VKSKEDLVMKKKLIAVFALTALTLVITPASPAFERHPEI